MYDIQPRNAQNAGISMRKIKKPLIEKKRRDRINKCLAELKTILLKDIQHTGTQISRLDKADVLELTVKYLQTVQRNQISAAIGSDPIVAVKYEIGFKECAQETMRYLKIRDGRIDLAKRLDTHLSVTVTDVLHAREDPNIVNGPSTPLTVTDVRYSREDPNVLNGSSTPLTAVSSHFSQNHSMKFEPISPPISAFQEAAPSFHQNESLDVKPSSSIREDKSESFRCLISAHMNQVVVPCRLQSVWRPW